MTSENSDSRQSWQLLEAVPETSYRRLVVKASNETDRHLAAFYAEAAERLAGTFKGQPADDMILLPFLTLYRQAYELELKSIIRDWTRLRRELADANDPFLDRENVNKRLRLKHRHNLDALLAEARSHFNELDERFDLRAEFPEQVVRVIGLLHEADESGTTFRYVSDHHPSQEERIDFPNLVRMLKQAFDILGAVEDYVDSVMEGVRDALGEMERNMP
ncbi:hypothetical protein J2W20_002394 [Sinomonas atrocyanea]|uniref:hypothetical protein n=1 Tax=Sinomonas atrocyanea TaxID=37927 RepID=UPI0027864D81|nr:hypothetical protein [Sinomonas atrocyanea]MDQ0260490.1 hypothetical protein [Sinomonas atrocyanea]